MPPTTNTTKKSELENKNGLLDKYRVWFFPAQPEEVELEETEEAIRSTFGVMTRGDDEGGDKAGTDLNTGRIYENRRMIWENRKRLVRIDERTAFIARIIFVLFIALIVSIGSGLVVAYVM